MSDLWPHFTQSKRCPACGHWDWTCRAGDKVFICMRVRSNKPSEDGGWYHPYGDNKPALPTWRPPQRQRRDFQNESLGKTQPEDLNVLAQSLGVSKASLIALGVVWANGIWKVPMRDGDNNLIGMHLRCQDGSKKAVSGSRNGLFIPQIDQEKIAYLPEGMSNTAALLTMGFYAIGRPSCNSGGEMLKAALRRLKIHRAVIVADNDRIKQPEQRKWFRPGQEGAEKLKKELGPIAAVFYTPTNPIKDVRQLLNLVGPEQARLIIESTTEKEVWK